MPVTQLPTYKNGEEGRTLSEGTVPKGFPSQRAFVFFPESNEWVTYLR